MHVSEKWLAEYQAKRNGGQQKKKARNTKKVAVPDYDIAKCATDIIEHAIKRCPSSPMLVGLNCNLKSMFSPTSENAPMQWEEMEQQMFLLYLESYFPSVFEMTTAMPLGGHRLNGVGGSLKGQGVKLGFADILTDFPANGYHGLRIELKRYSTSARASDDQVNWARNHAKHGYAIAHCHGHQAAIYYLHKYLRIDSIFIKINHVYKWCLNDFSGLMPTNGEIL